MSSGMYQDGEVQANRPTPIDQQLREKWAREADDFAFQVPYNGTTDFYDAGKINGYLAACEARHREYQDRVATLEGLLREAIPKLERAKQSYLAKMDYVEAAEFHAVYLKCCASLSPPPAKQQEP